ncbi:hypothetical protein GALMADRAFT_162397 [Galerina marginata CBS 339.88]|uniref:RING-type E3 ubiquitin transferase n=1 Tax=Galerina marginata (strain CBS 339.88) TaxID=685588 RepID=A0A067SD95_GALM3|nr:hypothetical protein GALMADRAFT_162397 [Galerina marginata CBS 339.88]
MSSCTRPSTSKSRGVCRYYNVPRGCFAGDKCKFLHGEPPIDAKPGDPPLLTPYDKAKRCRYFAQGFCKRGDACWFVHAVDSKDDTRSPARPLDEDEDELCSICFEKPTTYGLLGGCSHVFCTTCIKQWRDPQNKPGGVLDSGNTKKCPMCRAPSKFITPSSRFLKEGTVEKATVTQAYKESMARVPCRYFQKSMQKNKDKPICPYGKDCFYQHLKEDGTPYIFKDGVDVCMRKYRLSHGRGIPFEDIHFMPFSLDLSNLDIVIPNLLPPRSNRMEIDDWTQNRGGGANGVAHAARRLRDVGRSLEIFNDAIGEGATLDTLDYAVEALRAGLGRLDGTNNNPEARMHRRSERNRDEAAARQEDDVMERLELLADQMLASINALRNPDNPGGGSRSNTPPPPLEPIERGSAGTPPPPLIPVIERRHASLQDGNDSDDSLPALQSVSDSSDDDDDDYTSSDDESSDDDVDGYRNLELAGLHLPELFEGWSTARLASTGGPTPVTSEDTGTSTAEVEARPSVRFRTAVDRSQTQTPSRANSAFNDELPPLEAIDDSDSESDLPPPPPPSLPIEPTEPTSDADRPGPPSNTDPPFVTDGRGRVVWTRPSEENKGEAAAETSEAPAEESGRESGTGSGSSAGTGRSILGWINALF